MRTAIWARCTDTSGVPGRRQAAALLAVAGALALLGLAADAGGRVLAWPAAVLLSATALRDLLLGPALRADRDHVVVVSGWRTTAVPWSAVDRLRVVTDRRAPLLEVDAGDVLLLLSRWHLGRPPALVLDELSHLAPGRTRGPQPGS